jgi:hypothetical protein
MRNGKGKSFTCLCDDKKNQPQYFWLKPFRDDEDLAEIATPLKEPAARNDMVQRLQDGLRGTKPSFFIFSWWRERIAR